MERVQGELPEGLGDEDEGAVLVAGVAYAAAEPVLRVPERIEELLGPKRRTCSSRGLWIYNG